MRRRRHRQARLPVSGGLITATLLGLAPAALGEGLEMDAARLTKEGFDDLAAGAYERGITRLGRAYDIAKRPELLLNIAMAYDKWGGHCPEALEAFDRFLSACGECESAGLARERLHEVRDRCEPRLVVSTSPAGARVLLDGKQIGVSPLARTLSVGEHEVVVDLRYHQLHRQSIRLALGDVRKVEVQLRRIGDTWARLELRGVPPGVAVSVDGEPVVDPAAGPLRLLAGAHRVVVLPEQGASMSVPVELREGKGRYVDVGVLLAEPERTGLWGALAVGAGVAAVVLGVVFQGLADDASGRELAAVGAAPAAPEPMAETIHGHNRDARRNAVLAQVSWAVGGCGLLAGGTLLVLTWLAPSAVGPARAVGGGPGAGGALW